MEGESTELTEALRTQNTANQQQCYTAIHVTVGFLIFFSGMATLASLIMGAYERSIFLGAAVVFGVVTLMIMALNDFLASTIWWFLLMAFAGANLLLLMIDAKHFYGVCNKPYCTGWRYDAFIVFYVFATLNLMPLAVMLYFLWRIWALEAEDNKLNKPATY